MLNDAKVKAAKPREKPYKLVDTAQLYLHVTPAGGRYWRMNYAYGPSKKDPGRLTQKTLTLGSYPTMTLLEARGRRDAAKAILRQGKDPAVERRLALDEMADANENTFEVVANRWFELNSGWSLERFRAWMLEHKKFSKVAAPAWTDHVVDRWSVQQAYDIIHSFDLDIFPHIGNLPIAALKAPKLLKVLQEVERRGAIETAHRLRQRISAVFVYGISAGVCDGDPASGLGEALKDVPKSRPQPSIIDGLDDQGDRLPPAS